MPPMGSTVAISAPTYLMNSLTSKPSISVPRGGHNAATLSDLRHPLVSACRAHARRPRLRYTLDVVQGRRFAEAVAEECEVSPETAFDDSVHPSVEELR